MKFLLLLALLWVNSAFAQYPNRANMALIKNDSLRGYPYFRECVNFLEESGYSIEYVDEVPNALITEPVEISGMDFLIRFELEVMGAFARLHGYIMDDREFKTTGFYPKEKVWVDAAYRSNKFSTWRLGFEEVVLIAEKLRSHVEGNVKWYIEDNTLFNKEINQP